MGTRALIWAFFGVAALTSYWYGNATAGHVFVVGGIIVTILHAIEVKVNRLLDDRGITVTDEEIRR